MPDPNDSIDHDPSASTPSPPPRSPALHVRLVDGTQDVLDRVYGHLSQAADWAQEPPLSRSIRSATRPSTRWRAASGRAGPPCSCNDAQATTPCTSPPRPVRPGHPLAGVVLRLRLPRRAPLPPDPPRRPAPALWDLVDPHLSRHRPPCGSGPTLHLPPRQAARRCSPA